VEGTQVHSTLIRTLLEQGRIEEANRFLGHPHILTHTVEAGKHLGSALGFPTVNLAFQPGVLVPAYGVYATKLYLGEEDTEGHIAVTNIGVRPTVEQTDRVTVEGFILDFSGDLYGKTLRMEFYHYLRGERRFESLQALTEEVMRNAEQTRQYFAAR
jgi:riboflavin kinase/FMN adenylyltransferase